MFKYTICSLLIISLFLSVFANPKSIEMEVYNPPVPEYISVSVAENHKPISPTLVSTNAIETETGIYEMSYYLGNDNTFSVTNKIPTFGDDITFTSELFIREGFPHYVLYTPSSSKPHQNIPLIFWMHGGGEFGGSDEYFMTTGLLKVLNEWQLEGFNAYVVCPQMKDDYCYNWCTDFALDVVSRLIDDLVANYNIDTDRIYLMGHSQGARGVLHHSYYLPEYFAASVAFSPFNPSVSARLITIPIKAYTEYRSDFTSHLEFVWGYENVTRMSAKHGLVPKLSLYIDEDNNNRSDIIEWLFEQKKDT